MTESPDHTSVRRYGSRSAAWRVRSKRQAAHQFVRFSLDWSVGCAARSIPIHLLHTLHFAGPS
jgi:hypothetical protein